MKNHWLEIYRIKNTLIFSFELIGMLSPIWVKVIPHAAKPEITVVSDSLSFIGLLQSKLRGMSRTGHDGLITQYNSQTQKPLNSLMIFDLKVLDIYFPRPNEGHLTFTAINRADILKFNSKF